VPAAASSRKLIEGPAGGSAALTLFTPRPSRQNHSLGASSNLREFLHRRATNIGHVRGRKAFAFSAAATRLAANRRRSSMIFTSIVRVRRRRQALIPVWPAESHTCLCVSGRH
jgi:hypothetical protein